MNTIADVLKRQGFKPKDNFPKKLLISIENGQVRVDHLRDDEQYEEHLDGVPQSFMTIELPE